jgi:hypothetical protein
MYEIYNKFYQVHGDRIKLFLRDLYLNGMNGPGKGKEFMGLVGFEPRKVLNSIPKKNKTSTKNLRSPDGSWYYTVEIVGQPNAWLPSEDVLSEGYDLVNHYASSGPLTSGLMASGPMQTRLKGLVNCGYDAWTRHSKGKVGMPSVPKEWFKKARNPETPLPDFSRVYDLVLGVKKI